MYAQTDNTTATSSRPSARTPNVSRAALRTRPLVQRAFIRYWEYIEPVRVTVLALRLVAALFLLVLGLLLMSAGDAWGVALLPAAAAVVAFGAWIFNTAGKGWPAVKA